MHHHPLISFERAGSFIEGAESVLFLARLGERTLRCYVTRTALVEYFGAHDGQGGTAASCLQAYDRNAALIHGVARRLIADEMPLPDGVLVITTDDVFRDSTRRVNRGFAAALAARA